MTVTTLTNRTVTLVGRGENLIDNNGLVIPVFVDSNGENFILSTSDESLDILSISNGTLINTGEVSGITVPLTNVVCVCFSSNYEISPQALLFAKGCGLNVDLCGFFLYEGTINSISCENNHLIFIVDLQNYQVFLDGFDSQGEITGFLNCSLDGVTSDSLSGYSRCDLYDVSGSMPQDPSEASSYCLTFYLLALGMNPDFVSYHD